LDPEVLWNGREEAGKALPGSVYSYRFDAGNFTQMRKWTLLN